MSNVTAIILAGGKGVRMRSDVPKQFLRINRFTILELTVRVYHNHPKINEIVIVTHPDYVDETKEIFKQDYYNKITRIVEGGSTRPESAYNGLKSISSSSQYVIFQDAVRPFINRETISSLVKYLKIYDGVKVVAPLVDGLVKVQNNMVYDVLMRENVFRAQSPEGFRRDIIKNALERELCTLERKGLTDLCWFVLKHYPNAKIYALNIGNLNIKITYEEDLLLSKLIYKIWSEKEDV